MDPKPSWSLARWLGPIENALQHWWLQRITAIVLIPLSLWFMVSFASLASADHAAVLGWLGSPVHLIAFLLFVLGSLYHAFLGIQVVIEDYVHSEALRSTSLFAGQLVLLLLGLTATLALLKIALFGAS